MVADGNPVSDSSAVSERAALMQHGGQQSMPEFQPSINNNAGNNSARQP